MIGSIPSLPDGGDTDQAGIRSHHFETGNRLGGFRFFFFRTLRDPTIEAHLPLVEGARSWWNGDMRTFHRFLAMAGLASLLPLGGGCVSPPTATNERLSQESIASATVGKKPGALERARFRMMR